MSKIFTKENDTFDAIKNLVGGRLAGRADGKNMSYEDGQIQPTQSAIDAELIRMQSEHDALAYARKRDSEYPSTKDFMEAYTEKEIGGSSGKWDAYVINYNKVRSDNPK